MAEFYIGGGVNISYSNVGGGFASIEYTDSYQGTVNWGTGNVDVEPKFINSEENNFHLLASSMLINGGHPDSLDSDGTATDIGAYPYLNSFSGPVWHVSTEGDDIAGTGSEETPFKSIQAAINFSESGDSVTVAEGTYFEHIDTRSRQIDIVGQGQENTIIDGMELGRPVKITAPVYFSGFTIQNGNVTDPLEDRGGGMLIDGSGGATIDNCLFTNNYNVHNGAHLKIGICNQLY